MLCHSCMGCFAVSRVYEVASGGVSRWGSCNATFLSQCGALQGDKPIPQCHVTSGRHVGVFDVGGLEQSHLCCGYAACFVLPLLAVLRVRKEVEKFAALSVEISDLSRGHVLDFRK